MGELEIFAIRIKELRESLKMTQTQFSEYVDIKQQTLSGYERGIMKPPLDIAKSIAEKCNVSIDWLCGLSDKRNHSNNIQTYRDLADLLFLINEYSVLDFQQDEDSTKTWCGFSDHILNGFLSEWLEATLIRENLTLNRQITKTMYDSWKKDKLEELDKRKIKRRKT